MDITIENNENYCECYMKNQSIDEVIYGIQNKHFVVYGAGSFANKFLRTVCRMGYIDNYLYSVVTKKDKNDMDSIRTIETVDRNTCIMVAAHDRNSIQMEHTLFKLGFKHYYIIYPYLVELGCGLPYKKNVEISVSEFIRKCMYGNYLAIIYLAIDDIVQHNGIGGELYIKYMNVFSKPKTSKSRFDALIDRVNYMRNTHIIEPYNIKINLDEHFILDGTHRIMIAKYFGIKTLRADLYHTEYRFYRDVFLDGKYISDSDMEAYFSLTEQNYIEKTRIEKLEQEIEV